MRQLQAVEEWKKHRCIGSIVAFVGMGKTFMGVVAIRRVLNAIKNANVIVVVPSEPIAKQWKKELVKCTTPFEKVEVITLRKAAKNYNKLECTLLIIDEIHTVPTKSNKMALYIPHDLVLGLTGTYERLDGAHSLVDRVAPVVERIPLSEGVKNGWTSQHNIYCVLCEVDDIAVYDEYTRKFRAAFSFFGYNFNVPMKILTEKDYRMQYVSDSVEEEFGPSLNPAMRKRAFGEMFTKTMNAAKSFMDNMTKRKSFIYHHPKKIEVANKIIEAHSGKKGMTFWSTIEDAERVKYGETYACSGGSSDDGKKRTKKGNEQIIERFKATPGAVINTVRALNTGFNVPEIEFGIMGGFNSSQTIGNQSRGRLIRINDLTKNKNARIFYIVLRDTVDQTWFAKCIGTTEYLTILEEDLDDFLAGKPIDFGPKIKEKGSRY